MATIGPNLPSVESELLGAILSTPGALDACEGLLEPKDMASDVHARIFAAAHTVYEQGGTPDCANVAAHLKGVPESYLVELSIKAGSNVSHSARLLKQVSILRGLVGAGARLSKESLEVTADPFELISKYTDELTAMLSGTNITTSAHTRDLVHAAAKQIDDMASGEFKRRAILTGYNTYDYLTNGWMKKRLIVVAGRPSMGKTSFAVNCAINIGKAKHGVGIFSLEQSKEELMLRMLCRECGMRYNDVHAGRVRTTRMSLTEGMKVLSECNIVVDDGSGINFQQLRARTQRMIRQNSIDGIVIDYLQLMRTANARTRDEEIGILTRNLKALAKECNIFVVLLSQLNRSLETRKDKRPGLSDLRESGNIEQDADDVVFVHRPEYYDAEDRPGEAEVIVAKQRNGETGTSVLTFIKEHMRFENPPPPGMESLVPPPEQEDLS